MNGRFFAQAQIVAYISTGNERFSKSNQKKAGIDEDEAEGANKSEEEGERLDKFGSWLEEGEKEAEVESEEKEAKEEE